MATSMNGTNGTTTHQHDNTARFDPNFTQHVIEAMGPKTTPRMRQVMGSLIQHVHDFARENELTVSVNDDT